VEKKPGFITPPWPHTHGDSVSVESLIDRFAHDAHRSCGLYYEIYYWRLLNALHSLHDRLSPADAVTLQQVAQERGYDMSDHALEECRESYDQILAEIRKEQE
jgi:hypothetical protein